MAVGAQLKGQNVLRRCTEAFGQLAHEIALFLPCVLHRAAQRQHVISDTHVGDGAVLGAVESAIEQIKLKALGMNVGGKIGIARWDEHLCVAVYVGVGVLRFNEVAVGMAHRALRNDLKD